MLSILQQKLLTKACSVSPVKLVLQQIFLHSSHLRKGALHIPDLSMAAWHNGARQCGQGSALPSKQFSLTMA